MARRPRINLFPYVAKRPQADGTFRPRFIPGPRERALGYEGRDLRHETGAWFSLEEASGFALATQKAIVDARKTGKKLKAPPAPIGRAVRDLWNAYIKSDKFKSLADSSQRSYQNWIKPMEREPIWQAPIGALDPVVLKNLHEKIKRERGLAMASGMIAALQAALSWGRLKDWLPRDRSGQPINNPASKLDLESAAVRLRVATDAEIRALVAASDRTIVNGVTLCAVGDAVLTGLFSGQRKKDVLAFIPGPTTPNRVELVQSKTGARVSIPMAPRLIERIEQGAARRDRRHNQMPNAGARNVVLNEETGLPYNSTTFRQHFQQVRAEAVKVCPSLADFTFPDLRDTAVTWYARASCEIPEIASITGHSLKSIYDILKHYLALDAELADSAVKKLVDYMERQGMAV